MVETASPETKKDEILFDGIKYYYKILNQLKNKFFLPDQVDEFLWNKYQEFLPFLGTPSKEYVDQFNKIATAFLKTHDKNGTSKLLKNFAKYLQNLDGKGNPVQTGKKTNQFVEWFKKYFIKKTTQTIEPLEA